MRHEPYPDERGTDTGVGCLYAVISMLISLWGMGMIVQWSFG